jgi:myo-inositol-1(or 4)-monophosphatase
METTLAFAVHVTQQASALLMDYFKQKRLAYSLKLDQTLVTDADLAADKLISDAIHARYPEDVIISEELHPQNSSYPDNPDHAVWIVDPLDGSTNFRQGLHTWGVLLTRLINGFPQESVMHFPLLEETYMCQRGQGAFLNGNPIRVLQPDLDDHSSFFSCCSRTHRHYQVRVPYKTRILGSTGFSLCCVARGSAILGFDATPKIWDIAGGWLLIEEAGGIIDTIDGSQPFPLQPGINYALRSFPVLAAPTTELIALARKQISSRQATIPRPSTTPIE